MQQLDKTQNENFLEMLYSNIGHAIIEGRFIILLINNESSKILISFNSYNYSDTCCTFINYMHTILNFLHTRL